MSAVKLLQPVFDSLKNLPEKQIKGQLTNLADTLLGDTGVIRGLNGGYDASTQSIPFWKIKLQYRLEKLERHLEGKTGEDFELNTPFDIINEIVKYTTEKIWGEENEWDLKQGIENIVAQVKDGATEATVQLKDGTLEAIVQLQDGTSETFVRFKDGTSEWGEQFFELDQEAIETVEVDSVFAGLSASAFYAIYAVIKEFLSLEGARRRGEVSNQDIVKKVLQSALKSATSAAMAGFIFGVAVLIFGEWLMIPLAIIAPFAVIKLPMNLWNAFWKGLDETQRQELIDGANELGGAPARFFNSLRDSFRDSKLPVLSDAEIT